MAEKKESIFPVSDAPPASLVDEDLNYDNIVNNPILQPIAEANRSIIDFDKMIEKKLTEANRDATWIDEIVEQVPTYKEITLFNKMINLNSSVTDVIKMQDIQNKTLRKIIREIVKLVRQYYGVKVDVVPVDTVVTDQVELKYINYLKELINKSGGDILEIGKKILDAYNQDTTNNYEEDRFKNACVLVYKDEAVKSRKDIAGSIMRMEIQTPNLKGGE